jgi:hypothetical protein
MKTKNFNPRHAISRHLELLSPSATSIAPDLSLILKLLVTCMPSMVKVFISISLVSRFIPVLVAAKAPERPRQSSSGPVGAPSRDRIPA